MVQVRPKMKTTRQLTSEWDALAARIEAFERGEDDLADLSLELVIAACYHRFSKVIHGQMPSILNAQLSRYGRLGGRGRKGRTETPHITDRVVLEAWVSYFKRHQNVKVVAVDRAIGKQLDMSESWVRKRRLSKGFTGAKLRAAIRLKTGDNRRSTR